MILTLDDIEKCFDGLTGIQVALLLKVGFVAQPIVIRGTKDGYFFDSDHLKEVAAVTGLEADLSWLCPEGSAAEERCRYTDASLDRLKEIAAFTKGAEIKKIDNRLRRARKVGLIDFFEQRFGHPVSWYVKTWRYMTRWFRPQLSAKDQLDILLPESVAVALLPMRLAQAIGPRMRRLDSGKPFDRCLRVLIDYGHRLSVCSLDIRFEVIDALFEADPELAHLSPSEGLRRLREVEDAYSSVICEAVRYAAKFDPEKHIAKAVLSEDFFSETRLVLGRVKPAVGFDDLSKMIKHLMEVALGKGFKR
jgi:hypothetical protein